MTRQKRQELKFQGHIVDSYKAEGGYAKKWATDLTVGNPDLILVHPVLPMIHLAEVKHRPEWRLGETYKNPLRPKQISEAEKWIDGGGVTIGYVVIASTKAIGSILVLIDPVQPGVIMSQEWTSAYVAGKGYNIGKLLLKLKGEQ